MPEQIRLKKSQTIPFINTSAEDTESWARIGKSTIFDLALNANIITNDYIEDEMPTDEVDYYKPTLPQELQTIKGDPAYDFIFGMFYDMPIGEELKKDILIVFAGNIGTDEAPVFKAWKCKSTLILKDLNTVDSKILFDLNFGGNIEKGTVTITNGVPTFTPATQSVSTVMTKPADMPKVATTSAETSKVTSSSGK